jgi:hypothetical protein
MQPFLDGLTAKSVWNTLVAAIVPFVGLDGAPTGAEGEQLVHTTCMPFVCPGGHTTGWPPMMAPQGTNIATPGAT